MGITNIGTPQIEIALSEIGLFELAGDALKQLEITAISDSLAVLGQSTGIHKSSVLSTNRASYSLSGINTGVHRQYSLSGSVRTYETTSHSTHIRVEKYLEADASSLSVLGISSSILKTSLLSADVSGLSLQTSITSINGINKVVAGVGSLSLSGSSTGFKFDLNLPANTQVLVSQGISAGIKKGYVLSVETRNLIAQAEGLNFSGDKALFPEITPVILGLSETGLTVQRQASLGVQNLSLTVTGVDLVTTRVLDAEDTQLVFNEPIVALRKFNLQASGMSLFIQEQDTNLYKQARLNLTNVFIDLGTSSTVLKTARKILPQVNNVALYSGLVALVKRSRLIAETQELIGSLTESRVIYARVLLPIKSDMVQTSNESVLLLKRYLNALDSSNHLEVQEALLKYFRTLRLNVYDLNLNDSITWFMRSDLPEGFFRLVRQLESRQSILPEENRVTIMESP